MTAIDAKFVDDARAVLGFIADHPELPALVTITHRITMNPVGRTHHEVQLVSNRYRNVIPSVLAWHDALSGQRVVLDGYDDDVDPSVHIGITGEVPTGQAIRVFVAVYGATVEGLRRAADMGVDEKGKEVPVEVLRRLSDARGPGAGA